MIRNHCGLLAGYAGRRQLSPRLPFRAAPAAYSVASKTLLQRALRGNQELYTIQVDAGSGHALQNQGRRISATADNADCNTPCRSNPFHSQGPYILASLRRPPPVYYYAHEFDFVKQEDSRNSLRLTPARASRKW